MAASKAIKELERLKHGSGTKDKGTAQEGTPDPEGKKGSSIPLAVMDQWLDHIEGDPAQLLRNQFRLAEQQEIQHHARQLMETRPW